MQGPQLFGASGRGPQEFGVFDSTPFIKPKPLTRYFRTNDDLSLIETNTRLISDPKVGFRTKFDILGEVPEDGTIVSQNISGASASREFQIFWDNGTDFNVVIGGGITNLATDLTRGSFVIDFDGTSIRVFKNSNLVETITATAGTASEPTATTTIQARHDGSLSSYAFHYVGVIANVEVGDFNANPEGRYAINDNSNDIEDSSGNGNDATVVNGNTSDWELFNQQADGDYLGQNISLAESTPILGDDSNPEFFTVANVAIGFEYRINATFSNSGLSGAGCGWGTTSGVPSTPEFRSNSWNVGDTVGGDFIATSAGIIQVFGREGAANASYDQLRTNRLLRVA